MIIMEKKELNRYDPDCTQCKGSGLYMDERMRGIIEEFECDCDEYYEDPNTGGIDYEEPDWK